MMTRHKFNAKSVEDDGQHFSSKLEHRYYRLLKLLQRTGEVLFFLRQVPFHLPGGGKYVCDFQVFYETGEVRFEEVKGVETSEFTLKIKLVESLYPVKITVLKKGDF